MKNILLMGMIVLAVSNAAMAINVTNFSFEDPAQDSGGFTFSSPAGWTGVGGVERTSDSARYGGIDPFTAPGDGLQVGYINKITNISFM